MKHSQRDTVHRVRAVRSWLEKAEASFDEESDIKGELNLMLAEAEMKNLRKHHPVSRNWLRAGAMVTSFFLALGGWYAFRLTGPEERPPAVEAVVQETAAGNEADRDPVDTAAPVAEPVPAGSVQPPVQEGPAPVAASAPPAAPAGDEPPVQPAATAKPYRNRQQRLRYGWQGRQSCRTARYKLLYKKHVIPCAVQVLRNR